MQASNAPAKIQTPFANAGDKQAIPVASQIGITDGRASYTDGFPPLTRTPIVAGGVPPFGTDMNGILNAVTAIQKWQSAGGSFAYDGSFSTAVGGYPKGAVLARAGYDGFWISTTDNNTANPDTGGAGWSAAFPAGVVGQSRNAAMTVSAASASATLTADEIIVSTALGGQNYRLSSFSKTINLATTGAGGMDTGTVPAAGYVAIYAIYNPSTGASALLAVNASSSPAPEVYGGVNMPSGYTASALVAVWRTASSILAAGAMVGRQVITPYALVGSTSSQITTLTLLSLSAVIPPNAKSISGFLSIGTQNSTNGVTAIASSSSAFGQFQVSGNGTTAGVISITGAPFSGMKLLVAQSVYWSSTVASGTFTSGGVYISGYEF